VAQQDVLLQGVSAANPTQGDIVPEYCLGTVAGNPPCQTPSASESAAAARSRHVGGVGVVLLDGGVKFVDDTIETSVWRASSTTKGGESLKLP